MSGNDKKIPTRVLTGFMELLPEEQMVFNRMLDTIKETYELYGFSPIDTPVIERTEVLLANVGGETAKQVYSFSRGKNDLSLRFDLTVPLARYVSENAGDLNFPFRRYHIGKVYRGERAQKGRFREFYQCDIDIIGNETLSLINDAEIPRVIYDVFSRLDIGKFLIRISNRKLLMGLLGSLGVTEESSVEVMRAVDKLEKVGKEEVKKMLAEIGLSGRDVEAVFELLSIEGDTDSKLATLRSLGVEGSTFETGVSELSEVVSSMRSLGMPEDSYIIDLTIARGLDYYTGVVYETELVDRPEMGSVCSGGRYENLAENYSKRKLPGVGISIGLTRLFYQLKEAGVLKFESGSPTEIMVAPLLEDLSVPLEVATMLREANLSTEVYFEGGKLDKKLTYANRKGIPYVVIIGEDEVSSGLFTVKDMGSGEQVKLRKEQILSYIKEGNRDA